MSAIKRMLASLDQRLYLCALLMDMVTGALVFTVTRRAADTGVEPGVVGFLLASLFLAYAVSAPLTGRIADRISRRGLMLFGSVVITAMTLGCMAATDAKVLAMLMAGFGLGMAFYWPPKIAWLSHGKTGRRLAVSLALFALAFNAGFFVANAGAGALYFQRSAVPSGTPPVQVPVGLLRKFSYDADGHRIVLRGSCTDAEVSVMKAANPSNAAREAIARLVRCSRHFPVPLIVAAFVPLCVIALLLLPARVAEPGGPVQPLGSADCMGATRQPAWVLLWTAWIGSFGSTLVGSGTRAVFPALANSLEIAPNVHGLLASGAQATAVATFLLMQLWYFWHGRVWPLLLAQGLAVFGLLLISSTTSLALFGAGFLLMGINSGYCIYASQYYSLELFAAHCKGRASGLTEGIVGSGLVVGPLAAGLLGQLVELRAALLFLGAALLLLMAVNTALGGRRWATKRLPEEGEPLASQA